MTNFEKYAHLGDKELSAKFLGTADEFATDFVNWLREPAEPDFVLPDWFKVGETIAHRPPKDDSYKFRRVTAIGNIKGYAVACRLDDDSWNLPGEHFACNIIRPATLRPWTLEELTSHLQQDVINTSDTTVQPRIMGVEKTLPTDDWRVCLSFHRAGVTQRYFRSLKTLMIDHTLKSGERCGSWTIG